MFDLESLIFELNAQIMFRNNLPVEWNISLKFSRIYGNILHKIMPGYFPFRNKVKQLSNKLKAVSF